MQNNPPCIKETQFGWCKGKFTYPTGTGNYCIFHKPKGLPKDSAIFKGEVFQKINEAKEQDKKCDLSGTVFIDDISFGIFDNDNPLPEIDFSRCLFCGEVDFKNVVFEGPVTFGWGIFEKDVYFNQAKFNKKTEFYCTAFKGGAYFLYAEFVEEADFTEIVFEGEAIFIRKTFLNGADFNATGTKDRISFDQVDLKKVSFLDCDLRKFEFINCIFPRVEGNRRALYDELFVRKLVPIEKKKEDEDDPAAGDTDAEKKMDALERVEILYRRLKQKYLDEHDYSQASEWHVREKEMLKRRLEIKNFFSFFLLRLYKLSSDYGENPGRAFLVLMIMICAVVGFFFIFGMQKTGFKPEVIQISCFHNFNLNEVGQVFLSVLRFLSFQKDISLIPVGIGGEFVRLLSQIFIPLQAALFGLAVRNKFRR